MSPIAVILAVLVGAATVIPIVAAVRTVPDRLPLRDGFGPLPDLPRWAPVAAVVTGLGWGLVAHKFERWYLALPFLVLVSVLVAMAIIDVQHFRIPDRITFPALGIGAVLLLFAANRWSDATGGALSTLDFAKGAIIGALVFFAALLVPHLVSPAGMGFGDVKFGLVLGLHLGWLSAGHVADAIALVLYALVAGCLLGVAMGLAAVARQGKGTAFPFGPALGVGAFVVILLFDRIIG